MSTKEQLLKMEVITEIAAKEDQAFKNVLASLINQKTYHEAEAAKLQVKMDALTLSNFKDEKSRNYVYDSIYKLPNNVIYEIKGTL